MTTWVDEVLSGDTRYDILDNAGATVHGNVQVNLKTSVVTAGTPVTAAAMNLLEQIHNLPEGTMINGRILPSVASNNLTLALKTLAGADPSATDPVCVVLGGVLYVISAALSVTKNAATNWMNLGSAELATKEADLFAYLGHNATDGVVIAHSRIPFGTIYSDFSTTSTNEKYAAISNIAHAAAGDPYSVIGRFAATLSAGAGYTWTVPTYTAANLVQRPIYETRILTWAPTHSRSTVNYTGLPTTNMAEYQVIGRSIMYGEQHMQAVTPGGTGQQLFTLPFSIAARRVNAGMNLSTATSLIAYGEVGTFISIFKYDGTIECTGSQIYLVSGMYRY